AALEHVGGAGDLGQRRREQAASARFGGSNLELLAAAKIEQRLGPLDRLAIHLSVCHWNRPALPLIPPPTGIHNHLLRACELGPRFRGDERLLWQDAL